MYIGVFVGLVGTITVVVTDKTRVGTGDEVLRILGNGVPVTKDAPGVRKTLNQLGWVRMAGSIAWINPSGRCVRKPLFGSR